MKKQFRVGDFIEYETEPNPETHETELIPGVVIALLPEGKLRFIGDKGVKMEVSEEYCEGVYDCFECQDTGYVETAGGKLVDDVWIPSKIKCKCK